ncbi:MAG: LysM peptidoglycan-binding domain-containing protein [Saprospirales bacterium]|nr:MAG: LysM peptidoglycan-binding domain-containing protein [Saprospirales bacterium]
MTKLIRIFYLVFILTPFSLLAQKEIQVSLEIDGNILYHHGVQQGETFFGISRTYGVNVDQLISTNQATVRAGLSPGDQIIIKFDPERISSNADENSHILLYEVEPGTTLFAIRRASGLSISDLKKINNLSSADLSPGQILVVGYFDTTPSLPISRESDSRDTQPSSQNNLTQAEPSTQVPGTITHEEVNLKNPPKTATIIEMNYEEQRGVAVWNQDWKSTTGFYVLHRDAPINSIIEIENPMFGRKAYGKVSGRIPVSLYSSDVILIVSDALARHLGVIDQRFFVKVRYLQAD